MEVLAGGCLQHMWCTAGTAPSPRRSGWGGSHCSMGLRAPITSSRSPIPVGLRRAAPPPKCPAPLGAAGCPPGPDAAVRGSRCPPQCWGSLRCRQPMAEGGGTTPTDGRSPPGSAASDVCCEHSSARRALNHPAERSVMEDGGCAAVMAAPWGGGRWMRCCREALLSAPPSLPPRHRSLVGTAALWVPFVPVVPTPVLCGRWGSAGGAPLSRPH